MRDPQRIKLILQNIERIWEKGPDLRFNQLVMNLQYEYAKENGSCMLELWSKESYPRGAHVYEKIDMPDLFHVEDDKFLEFLSRK